MPEVAEKKLQRENLSREAGAENLPSEAGTENQNLSSEALRGKLEACLKDSLFYQDLSGLALGVYVGKNSSLPYGEVHFEGAKGYQNIENKAPLKESHVFHSASVSKLFTGLSILLLQEKGLLNLSDKLLEILPWVEIEDRRVEGVTIEQMLTHTSGLGDVDGYAWESPRVDSGALKHYCQSDEVRKKPLLWNPGEGGFAYSNIAYELLGCVIKGKSGLSFEDYVMENIFKPLGMENSNLNTFNRSHKVLGGDPENPECVKACLDLEVLASLGLALPHYKDETKHIRLQSYYPYNREHGPSSTLTTNVGDLIKFGKSIFYGGVLPKEIMEMALSPHELVPNNGEHIGYSWFIREQEGYTLYGHEGNDDGFRSSFWICPQLETCVVVLSNLNKAPVKKINRQVFSILTQGI